MNTEIVALDSTDPGSRSAIARAAELLRAGRLVAFPTETVYGLGANALDPAAVRGVFGAKGSTVRRTRSLYTLADPSQVANVAAEWPATAARLAERFWPGPLTIVVPKRPAVPDEVTAGGPTVAVRCPNHPVAQALLRAAGVPLAAPSANRSTELSPTRAEHVLKSLGGRIDMILDGGPCPGGIESTVVDVTGAGGPRAPPGARHGADAGGSGRQGGEWAAQAEGVARSPGQMEKHYSPRTRLRLVNWNDLLEDSIEAQQAGLRVGSVSFFREDAASNEAIGTKRPARQLARGPRPRGFVAVRSAVPARPVGLDLILVEIPPDTPEWAAIRDRLTRAAGRS